MKHLRIHTRDPRPHLLLIDRLSFRIDRSLPFPSAYRTGWRSSWWRLREWTAPLLSRSRLWLREQLRIFAYSSVSSSWLLDQSAKKRKTQMPHADGSKPSAQDLLLCAKHLFVAAMVAWVHPGPAAKRELIDLRP
jgi:hypothetical protein